MFKELHELYQLVEETVALLRSRFPQEIACKPGCADCCSAVFDVSLIEAVNIAHHFKELAPATQQKIGGRAEKAMDEWQALFAGPTDPAQARIRCPLLGADNLCQLYQARPVNCRTYGVPTVINGAAHVCGLSRFAKGSSYPTIQLEPLQQRLFEISVAAADEARGARRFPVARVLLAPDSFLSYLKSA